MKLRNRIWRLLTGIALMKGGLALHQAGGDIRALPQQIHFHPIGPSEIQAYWTWGLSHLRARPDSTASSHKIVCITPILGRTCFGEPITIRDLSYRPKANSR